MRLDIKPDIELLLKDMGTMRLKQVPYALSRTINKMLLNIQQVQREHQRRAYTIRRRDFADRAVKIGRGDFATKDRLVGRVGYQGDQGDIFAKFEAGGEKRSPSGRNVWTPTSFARRTKSDIITKGNRPHGLNLRPVHSSIAKGSTLYRGDKRTLMIRYRDGSGLVLQRFGRRMRGRKRKHQVQEQRRAGFRHDEGLKALFVYLARAPQLPASLKFLAQAQRVLDTTFSTTLAAELDAALFAPARTARRT